MYRSGMDMIGGAGSVHVVGGVYIRAFFASAQFCSAIKIALKSNL